MNSVNEFNEENFNTITINIKDKQYKILTINKDNKIYYKANDIGKFLNIKNIRDSLKTYHRYYFNLITKYGNNDTAFIDINTLIKFLVNTRSINKNILAEYLNLSINNIVKDNYENNIFNKIIKVFSKEKYIHQFSILSYRIDLYFPEYKLAIECDEKTGHKNIEEDLIRQNKIEKELNCTFIRFTPDEKDFDIFDVISKIHYHIINYNKIE